MSTSTHGWDGAPRAIEAPSALSWGRPEIVILGVALVARLCWAVIVPVVPVSDCVAYDVLARNMASGHGYTFEPGGPPSAYWPVGYPAILGGLYRAFGYDFRPAVVLNILLGVAAVAIPMRLTGRWFGALAGRVCGLLLALWPSQIEFVTVLASEGPFTTLMLVALGGWFCDRRRLLGAVLTGVALAAAAYVRPTALLLPVVFGLAGVLSGRGVARELTKVIIATVVMIGLIAPWTVRNFQVFGRFVLISTNGGTNLWMGNHPGTSGGYTPLPRDTEGMGEVERDEYLSRQAKDHIRQNPVAFVKGVVAKFVMTHDRETIGVIWNEPGLVGRLGPSVLTPLKAFSTVYWYAAAGLGLVGFVLLVRKEGVIAGVGHPVVLTTLYFATVHSVIVGQDRYHFPVIPLVAALAGFGTATLLRRNSVAP